MLHKKPSPAGLMFQSFLRRSFPASLMACCNRRQAVWLLSLLLCLSNLMMTTPAQVSLRERRAERLRSRNQAKPRKIAPDLEEKLAQTKRGIKASDLKYRVIIQPDDLASRAAIRNSLARASGRVQKDFDNFNLITAELPLWRVRELADSNLVCITPDREIRTPDTGHVERAMGKIDMEQNLGTGINGKDMNIAVLDSGIWGSHHAIGDRLLLSMDFTGEGLTKADPFGHGTHVASLAIGKNHVAKGAYEGIATGAKAADLRVLDSLGAGRVSWVLNALNRVKINAASKKIRVVNLSLGAPAVESCKYDPLCRAVRSLTDAGIVVVAAAGNDGKDANGNKVYGRIHSPGNEPSAITVGATNDFGTDSRSDDGVASYSSRGPSRSFWTDTTGIRHYDNLIKPELVATGNKLLSAEADNNYPVRRQGNPDGGVSGNANHKYMRLSGTSMATPVVTGAVSLMLQVNPTLTPNLVKAILMYTAQPLAGYNMFEQGAGQLNIEGATRLAKLVRTDLSATTAVGAPLLTASAPAPTSTIVGYTFTWAQGLILNQTWVSGNNLITKFQKVYGQGVALSDSVMLADGVMLADATKMTGGLSFGNSILTSKGVIFVYPFAHKSCRRQTPSGQSSG